MANVIMNEEEIVDSGEYLIIQVQYERDGFPEETYTWYASGVHLKSCFHEFEGHIFLDRCHLDDECNLSLVSKAHGDRQQPENLIHIVRVS